MNKELFQEIIGRLRFGFRQKVPVILQSESSECGLASLAMVSSFHGLQTDLVSLRRQFGISSHGATLAHLIQIAGGMKLHTRALSLELEELGELRTPCVLHWDMNHFVVLVGRRGNRWIVHDPAFGKRVLGIQEMSQHFTGVALEVWPDSEFTPYEKKSRLNFTNLLANVGGIKGALLKIFCFSLLIEAVNLLLPVGTQLVMDHVIIAQDHDLLILICIGLFVFTLSRSFISMLRAWTSLVMSSLIDIQWKAGLFGHLMQLPLAYFEKRKLGDIQARFNSLHVVANTLTTGLVNGIIDGIMTIGLLAMMFMYGGWLVWVVLGFTVAYLLLRFLTYQYYRQASEEQIVKDAKAGSHFMETLYGVGTLKALGLSPMRSQQWLNLNIDTSNATIRMTRMDMLFGGAGTFISTIDEIVILWLGASQVIDSHMTLGMFVALNAYRGQFSSRAGSLINLILQLRMLSLHSDRLADIVFEEGETYVQERKIAQQGEPAAIEVRDLMFQYDNLTRPVIADLSLRVDAGENVAIVGPSGTGKSTLMKIMTGLLTPTRGEVLFNGMDINKVGLNNYRSCIACVLQEDKLFSGSISDNIACFDTHKDEAFILDCAKQANIHEEIMQMPMGYETLLSELGGGMSGGQKQRLLIARALYRRPNILFMDEATSHLDLDNEAHINTAIRALNITRIIIAHRPSTIASADRVIELAPAGSVPGKNKE